MAPSSLLLVLLLVAPAQEKEPAPATPKVRVRLASDVRLNPSKAVLVRFTIENATDGEIDLDEPADYLDGLEVLDPDGKVLRPFGTATAAKRSLKLEKGGFIGRLVDIRPALEQAKAGDGLVKLTWKFGGATSNTIEPWLVRDYVATLDTTLGEMKLEFLPEAAPRHVLNFVDLARNKQYDGSTFHRVIPGFMAQAGQTKDPQTFRLKAEFNRYPHDVGTVSMARAPNQDDSAQAEFFICFSRLPGLDGKYTVFGQLVAGEPVLRKIEKAQTDHSPCSKCGKVEGKTTPCCGSHHEDRPKVDIVIKSITIAEKETK